MTKDARQNYQPDMAIPPGETIREAMEARGMNQAELANRLKKTKQEITSIIRGEQKISPEVALRLEAVMSIQASFWLNLQAQYDEALARIQRRQALEKEAKETTRFPYAKMAKLGWVPKTRIITEKAQNLQKFFSISFLGKVAEFHQAAYDPQYRKSAKHKANPDHLAAWLRRGEIDARATETASFDKAGLRNSLDELRALTLLPAPNAGKHLREICLGIGVAVVFLPHLPKTHVNGATMWLTSGGSTAKNKPVIMLSVRYRWADIFWFTLFHEICHVLSEKKNHVFVDLRDGAEDVEEATANKFSADLLIPPRDHQRFRRNMFFPSARVEQFAKDIGIHPGIVVGRLQYDGDIPRQNLNKLRAQYSIGNDQ